MGLGDRMIYPILGFASCLAFIYVFFGGDLFAADRRPAGRMDFVRRNGTHFVVDGKVFYVNGWNSYWLMDHAVDDYSRERVREMMLTGARMGLTVCRSWAFNDGAYNALQISPGNFDERVFRALDHVIMEARQHGIRLILCLVNNLQAYGGKNQYVQWAWQDGVGLSASNDSFFYDPSIRMYYKDFVKVVLTRKNTITGVEYRDDPTIFAWELMNEPRCMTDPSGDTLQDWIAEMAAYVKSIDQNHMVTVGLEGFYGPKSKKMLTVNPAPGEWAARLGSDFIRNSELPSIDFASAHIYPDHWFHEEGFEEKMKFVKLWTKSHIDDGDTELGKPILFTEMGYSNLNKDYDPSQRDKFFKTIYNIIHASAKKNGAAAGSLVWQFLVGGMEEYNDDFGMIPWERESTYKLVTQQSCRMAKASRLPELTDSLKELCTKQQ
ncbi:hypothetical protein MLD38_015813 [Melastoma candidum]|uniref:Uncharacterized protein n=1 Tax=Melastoma candidum TaxID=119954 RepID=A0ACB9RQU8_9MYRT|nr:hypothetical protein MLD38_015813 [Melastoma candidum]